MKMARLNKELIEKEVDRLKEMVQTGEIMRYSERDLEKQFKLTRKTLRKHLTNIKQEIGSRDIKIISLRLINILDEIMSDIEKYWRLAKENEDEKAMMYYSKQMFYAIEKFTDFLERFGIKPKAQENINLQADITQRSIQINYIVPNGSNTDTIPTDE